MNNLSTRLLILSGVLGMVTVGLGAFAAHGLKTILPTDLLDVFNIGVQYQAWHTFAIVACAILMRTINCEKIQKGLFRASICFIIGIFCFSGSLYGLALTGAKWFGPITPFGGLMFIVGWGVFTFSAIKLNKDSQ